MSSMYTAATDFVDPYSGFRNTTKLPASIAGFKSTTDVEKGVLNSIGVQGTAASTSFCTHYG